MKNTILALTLLFASTSVQAITAAEFFDTQTEGERLAYIIASFEMAMPMYVDLGEKAKAECIRDWMLHSPEDAIDTINRYLSNPDNGKFTSAAIIRIVFNTHCFLQQNPE